MSDSPEPEPSPAPAPEMALPPRVAGRYRVVSLLGRGGFGAVVEAYDEVEDRSVALKLIRRDVNLDPRSERARDTTRGESRPVQTRSFGQTPSSSLDSNLTQAFKDEFRTLTQLHHPNLAAVYDFGRCPDIEGLYFTQELVQGTDLAVFCRGAAQPAIVEVFVQIARALDYIHALGLVHGDIKPSNILITTNEGGSPQAKLIDFGLARMLRGSRSTSDEGESDQILVLGTPGFSAPEKVRGEPTDARSDIYSLAATLHAAVRGQRPFLGKTFQETLRAQLDWRPELAGALLAQCGPVLADLVGRMLQPDPEQRPQSARSIVLEILRREAPHLRGVGGNDQDRREFARMFVEHLPFVDRGGTNNLLQEKAAVILRPPQPGESHAGASRSGARGRLIRTVVIEAPEGMGKHRLLSELRREIQLGDGLFFESSCWSSDQGPLAPFASIVLQIAGTLGERNATVRAFAPIVSALRERADVGVERLLEFLVAAAADHPFVMHLADLSQGAEVTRAAFEQLCRAIDHTEARILLCATTQPHAKMTPTLHALGRDQVAELWRLRPFSPREMFTILQSMLGETPILRDLTALLDKLTGGHPLSFRETLRVLIEEAVLTREGDGWSLRSASAAAEELQKTLTQRSEARLDALGVSAWEIACVLFLLEAPVDEDQLAALSDLRAERFRRTLERLEGEGLVVRNHAKGNVVQLAHESVRDAVHRRYTDSLGEARIDLAARIDELGSDDPHFVFLQARLLDDASTGLEPCEALEGYARRLIDAGQPQLGAEVLERLIRRLRRHGRIAGLPRLMSATLLLLERTGGALSDPAREAEHYEAGLLVAELMGNERAQALLWLGLADRYIGAGHTDVGLALERIESAADAARRAHDRVLELRIANRRAEILLGVGEVEKAARWSRDAMEIVDLAEANPTDKSHIIGVRLRCLALSGQLGEARRLHDFARPLAAATPVVQRNSYLSGVAFLAVLGGDAQRAIPEIRGAVEELRAANLQRLMLTPIHNLGDLELRSGNLPAAEDAFREVIRLGSLYGFDYHIYLNRGFLGYVLARRGNLEEGAELLADARRGLTAIQGEHLALQQVRLLDAEVAHMLGHSARARRELEEMQADFMNANEVSLAHWAQEALARIERDLGTAFIEPPPNAAVDASDPDVDTIRTKPVPR